MMMYLNYNKQIIQTWNSGSKKLYLSYQLFCFNALGDKKLRYLNRQKCSPTLSLSSIKQLQQTVILNQCHHFQVCIQKTHTIILVIYCDQRYFQFKRGDPLGTYESASTKLKILSLQQISNESDAMHVVHTSFMAGYMSFKTSSSERGGGSIIEPNTTFQTQPTKDFISPQLQIEDFMEVTPISGFVKFINNSFAIYTIQDNLSVKYTLPIKNIQNYTHHQFDNERKLLYIGNGTHIMNYTLRIDTFTANNQVAGLSFQNQTTQFPQKINHTNFRVHKNQYLLIANNASNSTLSLYDFLRNPQNLTNNRRILQLFKKKNTTTTNTTTNTTSNSTTNTTNNSTNSNTTQNVTFNSTPIVIEVVDPFANMTKVWEYHGSKTLEILGLGDKIYIEDLPHSHSGQPVNRHLQLLVTSKTQTNATLRNLLQFELLISLQNASAITRGPNLVLKDLDIASLSHSSDLSLVASQNSDGYLQPHFVQQCAPSQYFKPQTGQCSPCQESQGTAYSQQTEFNSWGTPGCLNCGALVQSQDAFVRGLAWQVCEDPYLNIQIDDNKKNDTVDGQVGNKTIITISTETMSEETKIGIIVGVTVPLSLLLFCIPLAYFLFKKSNSAHAENEPTPTAEMIDGPLHKDMFKPTEVLDTDSQLIRESETAGVGCKQIPSFDFQETSSQHSGESGSQPEGVRVVNSRTPHKMEGFLRRGDIESGSSQIDDNSSVANKENTFDDSFTNRGSDDNVEKIKGNHLIPTMVSGRTTSPKTKQQSHQYPQQVISTAVLTTFNSAIKENELLRLRNPPEIWMNEIMSSRQFENTQRPLYDKDNIETQQKPLKAENMPKQKADMNDTFSVRSSELSSDEDNEPPKNKSYKKY